MDSQLVEAGRFFQFVVMRGQSGTFIILYFGYIDAAIKAENGEICISGGMVVWVTGLGTLNMLPQGSHHR
jgi:hypothetical protein